MKTSTRETIIVIFIVLLLAACTPAATPQADTGQEELAPTLTLSTTETPPPTEALTPTTTPIPPTPTFPAPEGADLPDSAVRSVNEQGREVILDQPGGEPLWTLVEDKHGDLAWQKATDYELAIPAALSEGNLARAAEMSQAAVESDQMEAQEVFAEFWQALIKQETPYSVEILARGQAEIAEFLVNDEGRVVMVDEERRVIFKEGRPEESDLAWYASPEVLASNLVDTEEQPLAKTLAKIRDKMDEFVDGLELSRFGDYAFFTIVDQIIPLDSDHELETGEVITHLMRYFYFADGLLQINGGGSTQVGHSPFFAYYDGANQHNFWVLGGGPTDRSSSSELMSSINNYKRGEKEFGNGPMTFNGVTKEFPIGPGQIMRISFAAEPANFTRSTEGFWDEAIATYHSAEELEAFAATGDFKEIEFEIPGVGGVLLPQHVATSRSHALVDVQVAEEE